MTINGLSCKIIERNSRKTVIEIDGQKITVPSENLPSKTALGEVLKVYILNSDEGLDAEKKLAKTILEEILNGK